MVDPPYGHSAEQVTGYTIELGRLSHLREIPELERAAGERFKAIGMKDVADGEATPLSILESRAEVRRLYVAIAPDQEIAGFLIWSPKDGRAHVEQVSVHPAHAGRRLAARMIDRLAADVRGTHAELSLTTFRDVPWNAPYYRNIGFIELAYAEAGPQHEDSWRHQAESGLDMARRLFMIKSL